MTSVGSGFASILFIIAAVIIVLYLIRAAAYFKIFAKAGENKFIAFIPVYNTYKKYVLTWRPMWFGAYIFCLFVMIIFMGSDGFFGMLSALGALDALTISVLSSYKFSRAFGHNFRFALGLVFLNPVFMLILGFDRSAYIGPQNVNIGGFII